MRFNFSVAALCYLSLTLIACSKKTDDPVIPKSSENQILSFSITTPATTTVSIDQTSKTINLTLPINSKVNSLTPIISASAKSTVNPASGIAQDFTNPVNYTVTAENGSNQVYTVSATVLKPLSNDFFLLVSSLRGLYSLSPTDGQLLWQNTNNNLSASSPTQYKGTIFIGTNYGVSAFRSSDGKLLWEYTKSRSYTTPFVKNDIVYFGTFDGNYVALDAYTGTQRWTFSTSSKTFQISSPTIDSNVLYFGSADGQLYALNANTGAKIWSYTTGKGINSSPCVTNGVVYTGSLDGYVYAIDAQKGTLKWRLKTNDQVGASPTISGSTLLVNSNDGNLYALNANTGEVVWTFSIGSPSIVGAIVDMSPTVMNNLVYIGSLPSSKKNALYAIDLKTGKLVWEYTLKSGQYATSPTVSERGVYIHAGEYGFSGSSTRSIQESVYNLDPQTGKLIWQFPISENWGVGSSPLILSTATAGQFESAVSGNTQ